MTNINDFVMVLRSAYNLESDNKGHIVMLITP